MRRVVEVIAFPDAEAVGVAFLKAELATRSDTAKVATKIPAIRPPRLVKVTRTGGLRRNLMTDSAQLTFECWDVAEAEAAALSRVVRAIIHAAPQLSLPLGAQCSRVQEVGGPVSFPDPDTALPRYQFTASLDFRGSII